MPRLFRKTDDDAHRASLPDAITLCNSAHRECLGLFSEMIETGIRARHPELVTLVLSTAQLAHTQMSLLKLESPYSAKTAPALVELCRSTALALSERPEVRSRERLLTLLDLTARSLSF